MKKPKARNPVAHHINRFNKPSIQKDKKKALKQGFVKHQAELSREFSASMKLMPSECNKIQDYQQAA